MRSYCHSFSFVLLLCIFITGSGSCYAGKIRIDRKDPLRPVVSVILPSSANLLKPVSPEEGKKWLAIYRVVNGKPATINVTGFYSLEQNILRFQPRFNLEPEMTYEAVAYGHEKAYRKEFSIPKADPSVPKAEVVRVFPLNDTIPSNILHFHILFSQSMSAEPNCYEHVWIMDKQGRKKEMVWKQREFWFDDRKLLVLMIHPGRVKRGITYLDTLGEVFKEGEEYTLIVTRNIKDRYQRPIRKEYKRTFIAGPDDHTSPEIRYNSFNIPKAGTIQPLKLSFSEEMDYMSVREGIRIFSADKTPVNGRFIYTASEKVWEFVPSDPWKDEQYEVQFGKTVTDFASNYLHRPFEISSLDELNEDEMPKKWGFKPLSR